MRKKDQIEFMRLLETSDDSDYAATWEEIGKAFGMSPQGAEQFCQCAKYKFRRNFIRRCFGKYYDSQI